MIQKRHKVTKAMVIGTAESVLATSSIAYFNEDGTYEHAGDTEIHWDSCETQTRNGKVVFVLENGDDCTIDDLEDVPELETV